MKSKPPSHDPLEQVVRGHDLVLSPAGILPPMVIRYASVPEVDLMARLAGLELVDRWSGWRREPFDASNSATRLGVRMCGLAGSSRSLVKTRVYSRLA